MPVLFSLISYVESWSTGIALPTAGLVSGDGVLACLHNVKDKTGSMAASEGGWLNWVSLRGWGGDNSLFHFFRTQAGAPPTNYNFTWTGSDRVTGALVRVTGHDPADPLNILSAIAVTGANPSSPSVTTDEDGCGVVRSIAAQRGPLVTDQGPTGNTTLYYREHNGGSPGAGVAHAAQASQGATGTAQWMDDLTGGSNSGVATIAINPGGAPPVGVGYTPHHIGPGIV